jgi:hypothetical protein
VQAQFCQQALSRGTVGATELHNLKAKVLHSPSLRLLWAG